MFSSTTVPMPFRADNLFPDDAEAQDRSELARMYDEMGANFDPSVPGPYNISAMTKLIAKAEAFMDAKYPEFEPEFFEFDDEVYYLPAYKVLHFDGRDFYSPLQGTRWPNFRLGATCVNHYGPSFFHKPPETFCGCGIYATTNIEEINDYLDTHGVFPGQSANVLAVIEPEEGAKVAMARKGWRASSARIRHVVGNSITLEAANRLLSTCWKYPVIATRAARIGMRGAV